MPGSILCPHPSRLRRAIFPRGEGFGERIVTVGILLPKNVLVREHPKAPLCKGSWQKSLIFD